MENQMENEFAKLRAFLLEELEKRTTSPDDFSEWREYILKELERQERCQVGILIRLDVTENRITELKSDTAHYGDMSDKIGDIQVQVGKVETVLKRLESERGRFWGKVGGIAAVVAVIISALAFLWSVKG